MTQKGPPKKPWEEERKPTFGESLLNAFFQSTMDHNRTYQSSDTYYRNQVGGCLLQLIFYCFLGFIIYLFIAWATAPSDYTFPTSEEWYEKFDVEDEFNLEVVDLFECSSDDIFEKPGFIGIDRKNRQILHTYYSGIMELNSTYKTDFNVDESNVTASYILKIKSVDVNSKRVMNFNTLTGYAYIDKFDLNNNGKKYTEEYFEKWNCGAVKLNTSNKTTNRDACVKRVKYSDGTYVNFGIHPDDYCPED